MVNWRCSRRGIRSRQGGLGVLQMYLKSGGVHVLLRGATISLSGGRTLEKLGPPGLSHPSAWKKREILRSSQ